MKSGQNLFRRTLQKPGLFLFDCFLMESERSEILLLWVLFQVLFVRKNSRQINFKWIKKEFSFVSEGFLSSWLVENEGRAAT
jgi:hypothetical protein